MGAKTGHHELKKRHQPLFLHSMWSKIIFEKTFFMHPGDLPVPFFWAPSLAYLVQLAAAQWASVRGSRCWLGQI